MENLEFLFTRGFTSEFHKANLQTNNPENSYNKTELLI